ncbi:MAG: aspartate--ammonia ligase [Spirochaetes bacterium]|nr:aspartate--ammonia ligase [Spirochaetota bacterium]
MQAKDFSQPVEMSILKTEEAIFYIKQNFQKNLADALRLYRVSSPIFLNRNTGMQDNLNGIEKPVSFAISALKQDGYEVVHSLAKWKRFALKKYGIDQGKGIYTDMNALRPDEEDLSTSLHSVYVDQWDWEKAISKEDRNLDFLKSTVRKIYNVLKLTEHDIEKTYDIPAFLPEDVTFIHTEDLVKEYPDLTPKQREDKICEKYHAVFLIGIGGQLPNGEIHDGRAPDYDDWTTPTVGGKKGLNGDIILWHPVLEKAFEVSSMGIRVDPETMKKQLEIRDCNDRLELPWHQMLINHEFPLSIGGGIGQSRLCMYFLRKRHIGEVQVGAWPDAVVEESSKQGIQLL